MDDRDDRDDRRVDWDNWPPDREESFLTFIAAKGKLSIVYNVYRLSHTHPVVPKTRMWIVSMRYGFGFSTLPMGDTGVEHRYIGVGLPFWIPTVLTAVYPTVHFVRGPLRRWRRRKAGQCVGCGYDLTGNVSGVCPECGGQI